MLPLLALSIESDPKLSPRSSTGSLSFSSGGESELLPGVPSISPDSVRATGSEPGLSPGVPLVSLLPGGLAFASAVCPSLEESVLLPGGSPSPFGSLCQIWGLEFKGCESCCGGVYHWILCCHGLTAGIEALLLPSRGRSLRFLRDGVQSTRVTSERWFRCGWH